MVYTLDPLSDPRWSGFIETHPCASAFHTTAWLEALRKTYGYQPVALTTSAPGAELRNALVFCRVDSWLTGRRWVSLPFSDHAEPLLSDPSELPELIAGAEARLGEENLRYFEVRPMRALPPEQFPGYAQSSFVFHEVDLTPDEQTLFKSLHAGNIQRKIKRAEREALTYSEGHSPEMVNDFYRLMIQTRKRHAIPPQPIDWFQNLASTFGDKLKIRIASKEGRAIAAILTLRHGRTLVYKYGCSDETEHNAGGMQMVMWRAIQEGHREGLATLDLGRSDCSNEGLITYKDRWGSQRSMLTYYRRNRAPDAAPAVESDAPDWKLRLAGPIFARMPAGVSSRVGGLLYRHMG